MTYLLQKDINKKNSKSPLIIFCAWGPVTKANTLSGIPYYLKPELEKYFSLQVYDDIKENSLSATQMLFYRILEVLEFGHNYLLKKKFVFDGIKLSWCYLASKKMQKVITNNKGIPVLSFGLSTSVFIKRDQQVFQYLDGIYSYKQALYPWTNQKQLSFLERFYLKYVDKYGSRNAEKIFTTSDTIKDQTISLLTRIGNTPQIINVGIGSNVKEGGIGQASTKPVKLLLIYTNFKRKGGDVAYEISRLLTNLRVPHEFHFIGRVPEDHIDQPNFKWYGYIDKVTEESRYVEILQKCNINVMPTLGDLTPHTICECNSYGIPTIANDVGGIRDLVGSGGVLIKGLSPIDFVEAILLVSKELVNRSTLSYQKYSTEQKWSVISEKIAQEIN